MTDYVMFIDDVRDPGPFFKDSLVVVCRSFKAVEKSLLELGYPTHVAFDHDLGEDTDANGLTCAHEFEKQFDALGPLPNGFTYSVHSMNPVGANNINAYMEWFVEHYKGE